MVQQLASEPESCIQVMCKCPTGKAVTVKGLLDTDYPLYESRVQEARYEDDCPSQWHSLASYNKVLNWTNCYFGSGPVKAILSSTWKDISFNEMHISSARSQSGSVEAEIWQFVTGSESI